MKSTPLIMAVYHWKKPDEIKEYFKVCNEHDLNAPREVVMNVIRKGLDLMDITKRYTRMFILCGDKKESPEGDAEFWFIDRQNDGSYEVGNEEGLEGLFVTSLTDAYSIICRAMKNKVIGDVSLKSPNCFGGEECTTLYCLIVSEEPGDMPIGVTSGQVRHDAATTIQKAFRRCITDPKYQMTQRRLMREFAELVE